MEFSDYTPGTVALARLPNVHFVAIIGPTAAGKTTLLAGAIARDPSIHLMVSTTSRAPRPGEQNGVDYHFYSEEEMRKRIHRREFVSVAPRALGDMYATAPEDYSTTGISATSIMAEAMSGFIALPFGILRQIFVLPPSWNEWQRRILAHGFTSEQITKRMDEAGKSFLYAQTASDLLFVTNDNRERATDDMLHILQGGLPRVTTEDGRLLAARLHEQLLATKND